MNSALILPATYFFAALHRVFRINAIYDMGYCSVPDSNLFEPFQPRASSLPVHFRNRPDSIGISLEVVRPCAGEPAFTVLNDTSAAHSDRERKSRRVDS